MSLPLHPNTSLYRRLLRAHRKLPVEMRYMGDSYVKSEFRSTKDTDNPLHIMAFLTQWKSYLDELEVALTEPGKWDGRKLDHEVMESLSSEQVGQLYELMHATGDVWKTCVVDTAPADSRPEELEAAAKKAEQDAEKE